MLVRTWKRQRRKYIWQRRSRNSVIFTAILAAFVSIAGCASSHRASLEKQFQEAYLQAQQGYLDQPQKSAENGLIRSADFADLHWKFQILAADIQSRRGLPSTALELTAEEPIKEISAESRLGRALTRAYAFCATSEADEAGKQFSLADTLSASLPSRAGDVLLAKARCEASRRNYTASAALFKTLLEQNSRSENFLKLFALNGLGTAAMRQRNFEEAVDWFMQTKELAVRLNALPLQEIALGNLGYVYAELLDFQHGLESSSKAAELAGQLGFLDHQEKWFLDVGRAYNQLSRQGLAQQNYYKALSIARARNDTPIIARCLHNLFVLALHYSKSLQDAEKLHTEDGELKLQDDDLRDFKIDEAVMVSAKHDWPKAEKLLLQLLSEVEGNYRLTSFLQGEMARVYAGSGDPGRADEWFQRSIATMVAAAEKMHKREFHTSMLDNWPIFDDYIAFLVAQKHPERALQVAQIARARTLEEDLGLKRRNEDTRVWMIRIHSMLRSRNAVLLAYYEAEHEAYVWAVTGHDFRVRVLDASQNDLETLADTYRQEIAQHTSPDQSPAQQRLYQLLIKPVQDMVPKDAHVILVADSALYRINFECLVSDRGRPHYWIEDAEIENASSIDLMLAGRHRPKTANGVLLIGDASESDPQFPRLPHAAEEMASVESQFSPAEVKKFSGAAATPEIYSEAHPGEFRYMEFAAHGTADSSDPLDSAIILSRGKNSEFRLTAREIEKHRLSSELVTISACYGVGTARTSAEGLLGLQSAFLRAGAHQVIAGLWDVDDASTPLLMGGVYEGVMHKKSAAAALRAAKLKILSPGKANRAPYYWGALQLYVGA